MPLRFQSMSRRNGCTCAFTRLALPLAVWHWRPARGAESLESLATLLFMYMRRQCTQNRVIFFGFNVDSKLGRFPGLKSTGIACHKLGHDV